MSLGIFFSNTGTLAELFYLVDGSARFGNFDLQVVRNTLECYEKYGWSKNKGLVRLY